MFPRIIIRLAGVWILGVGLAFTSPRAPGANQPPQFIPGPDVEANEDDGPRTFTGWATAIQPGAPDESGQTVRFEVTNKDLPLFAVQPAIDAEGTLSFTPAHGAYGATIVTVIAVDDGGTEDGGLDAGEPVDFLLTIHPVNDQPRFEVHASPVVDANSGPVALANWAYRLNPGSQFEVGQKFTFVVTTDSPALFAVQPAITADGTLTFAPAARASGTANVTAVAHDDGGRERGGIDASAPATFTITILSANQPPVPSLETDAGCWLSGSAEHVVVIANAKSQAKVQFDSSGSFDADGDSLRWHWLIDRLPISETNSTLTVSLAVGDHEISAVVSDGSSESAATIRVEVIEPVEGIEALAAEVTELVSNRSARRHLLAHLRATAFQIEHGRVRGAILQLIQFECAARQNVPLRRGSALIQHSREIRNALQTARHR